MSSNFCIEVVADQVRREMIKEALLRAANAEPCYHAAIEQTLRQKFAWLDVMVQRLTSQIEQGGSESRCDCKPSAICGCGKAIIMWHKADCEE